MLNEANDFREECDALRAVLESAPAESWSMATQFKGWTFDDILGHLYAFDHAAGLTLEGRERLLEFFAEIARGRDRGLPLTERTRHWLHGSHDGELLDRWHRSYVDLSNRYLSLEASQRVAWGGPDMSVRSLISARQMETWAHGQAVFDSLGLERTETDRIRNIAVMGVNTFGWTFVTNKRDVPAPRPYVRLTSPSGAVWEWNDADEENAVIGSAVDFCRVVTQTRNVTDTALDIRGDTAREWMAIAQCFAGDAHAPPAPGTRFMRR